MLQRLTAGDSLDFGVSVPNYPATDGWTLKYRLLPRAGGAAIELTAAADGEDYRIQVAPNVSGGWTAGEYDWTSWVEKAGARHVVEKAVALTIDPDPETVTAGTELRSQAQKAVDDCLAAMAVFQASGGGKVLEYEIAGRRMRFSDEGQIQDQYRFWRAALTRENAEKQVALGRADPRRIYLTMGRA